MTLLEKWKLASHDLDLEMIENFVLKISSSAQINSALLLKNFGDKNGMLIIRDYNEAEPYLEDIEEAGYGFCIMKDPPYKHDFYSKESIIEVLRDWGWTGPESERPDWF